MNVSSTGQPQNQRGSRVSELLKLLVAARTYVFFSVSILITGGLFYWASKTSGSSQAALVGVASSMLASTLFAWLQLFFTRSAFTDMLQSSISDAVEGSSKSIEAVVSTRMDKVLSFINRGWGEFIPMAEFPASSEPGDEFNNDFAVELERSGRYVFLGLTGRYVGPRLAAVDRRLNEVTVIIGNPATNEAVKIRQEQESPADQRPAIEAKLRAEVDLCLFGLFEHRHRHDRISLYLNPAPDLDRIEILDDCVYLALFSGSEQNRRFPRTLKFSGASFVCRTARRSAARVMASQASVRFDLSPQTGPEELMRFYASHLDRRIDEAEFGSLKANYASFESEFAHAVGLRLRK